MHDSKICFKCNVRKPLSDFYKHPAMVDGHVNKCKECNKKDVRDNYKANRDYYVEYEKGRANLPKRISGRLDYANSERGKIAQNAAKKKWSETNLIKRNASHIANKAVRDGKLFKPDNCSSCGVKSARIHGHHDDYYYPMTVRWLCPKCHSDWHKEHGSASNG